MSFLDHTSIGLKSVPAAVIGNSPGTGISGIGEGRDKWEESVEAVR